MRKKLLTFLLLLVTAFSGAALTASCGGDGGDNNKRVVVTYYLDENSNGVSTAILNGRFELAKIPTRPGYTFAGFYDSPSGGTKIVDENGNCMFEITTSLSLYARWNVITYQFVYDAGEGSIKNGSANEEYAFGAGLYSFPTAEKDGFDFVGWQLSSGKMCSDGNGSPLDGYDAFGEAYPISDGKVYFTAVYDVKKFTVICNFNDGTYETQEFKVNYGDGLDPATLPTRDTGKAEIVGWSTSQYSDVPFDGTVNGNMMLYAIWKDYKLFSLYEEQSGEPTEFRVYRYDEAVTLPTPEKFGFDFAGWYTSTLFQGLPTETVNYGSAKTTFYARWTLAEYEVNFESNGGGDFNAIYYNMEGEAALPTAEKENYTFLGWCKNEDLSDTPITKIPVGSYGDLTLYAKYKGDDRTTVLNAGGGTVNGNASADITVEYGAICKLPVGVYEGYAFNGWYLDESFETLVADDKGVGVSEWLYGETITLYAKYSKKYYVTVSVNNQAAVSVEVEQFYFEGKAVELSAIVKDGYTFNGWFKGDTKVCSGQDYGFYMGAEDVTLTVKVTANAYTVALKTENGAFCKENSATITFGETATLPVAYLSGYDFTGWYYGDERITDENGTLLKGWHIAENANLQAKYEEQEEGKQTFFIRTVSDWKNVINNPTASFILFNDLDLSSFSDKAEVSYGYVVLNFRGVFDGQGYTIKGLHTYLFERVTGGSVRNLTVEGNITGSNAHANNTICKGMLAGTLDGGTIQNVTAKGSISLNGRYDVGGIVGSTANTTKVIGCINNADITVTDCTNWSVGGIIGCAGGSPTIENNINYGDVSAAYVGGIVGAYGISGTIKGCKNYGDLTGTAIVGGIVRNGNDNTIIDGCVSRGKLTGGQVGKYVGSGRDNLKNIPDIEIGSVDDLWLFNRTYIGETYLLTADLDLTETEWTPVSFAATLDGQGHTITGVSIQSNIEILGFFTTVSGVIKNVKFENLTVVYTGGAGKNIGGVCGQLTGVLEGVQVLSGSVSSSVYSQVGGIVGVMEGGESSIKNCVNYANVTATTSQSSGAAAGVLAWMRGGTIENCDNYGDITGQWKVAGIIGAQHNSGTVIIQGCDNYGTLVGTNNSGGIVGETSGNSSNLIDGCISLGEIVGGVSNVGKYVGQGNVTYKDLIPIEIEKLKDFDQMKNAPAAETFLLTADIDMTDVEWTPFAFAGTLDGQGHTIKNFSILSADSRVGFFTQITGTVKNLKFENVEVESVAASSVGTLAGHSTATVENITVLSGMVKGGTCDLGGIIGAAGGGSVSNCTNYATLSNSAPQNTGSIGGIVASNGSCTTVTNCVNYGEITGNYRVGGISGWVNTNATYTNCKNYGSVTGGTYIGGILGQRAGGTVVLDGCISAGTLEGGSSIGKYVGTGAHTLQNVPTITIKTVDDLRLAKYNAAQENYVLEADLDLTEAGWTYVDFAGTFDGQEHTIKGLINTGLFGIVTGTVKNLTVEVDMEMHTIGSGGYLGGVANVLRNGTLTYITVKGSIVCTTSNSYDAGCVVGTADGTSSITYCTNYADMTCTNDTNYSKGGIAGSLNGSPTFTNNVNYGDITAAQSAGVVRYLGSNIVVKDCANYGTITGRSQVGGVVGTANTNGSVIDGCINEGELIWSGSVGKFVASGSVTYKNLKEVEISSVDELKYMVGAPTVEKYVITEDIDMSELTWKPFAFAAQLDGGDHTITGFTYEPDTTLTGNNDAGFFTNVTGTVKNLKFAEATVTVTTSDCPNIGVLCGTLNGTVENVHLLSGTVTATTADIGGLIGQFTGGSLKNCSNRATVINNSTSSSTDVGGVLGYATVPYFSNLENFGEVVGGYKAGGVVGLAKFSGTFTLTGLENHGKVSGTNRVGGVIGVIETASITLKDVVSDGKLVAGAPNMGKYVGYGTATYANLATVNIGDADSLYLLQYAPAGEKFLLTADMDMTGMEWDSTPFAGTLDGQNKTITGLTIESANEFVGFFSKLSGAVKNLNFKNAAITYSAKAGQAGTLCGYLDGAVENVNVLSGSVEATISPTSGEGIGGIVGWLYGGSVTNCKNYASVKALTTSSYGAAGGVIGSVKGGTVSACENYGDVDTPYNSGGVIGWANVSGSTTLKGLVNEGAVLGTTNVGGIVGCWASGSLVLDGCITTGAITGTTNVGKYLGKGTVTYTHLTTVEIGSADELYLMKYAPSVEKFVFTADIDMANVEWTPFDFAGTLDGQDNTIENFTLNTDAANVGFFANLSGTVKNLKFKNVEIEATNVSNPSVGTLAGKSTGTIENVTVLSGKLNGGKSGIGGIVGRPTGGTITACVNYANLTNEATSGHGSLGGIASTVSATAITDCENYGTITGNTYVGGIVGYVEKAITTKNCANYGTVTGVTSVGGIAGCGNATITIDKCISKGLFTGTSSVGKYVGSGSATYTFITNEIKTAEEFAAIRYNMANEPFKLMNDIDMDGVEWVSPAFAGKLDGKGFTVKNLTAESASGNFGMFLSVSGTIEDIKFENLNVTSTSYTAVTVGGIAPSITGTLDGVTIESGTIESELGDIGGFVGIMNAGTIKNCVNKAAVNGNDASNATGGIAGDFTGGTVTDCTNYGTITDETKYTGGIFGYASATGFSGVVNYGTVVGKEWTGGVIGQFKIAGSYTYNKPMINYGEVTGETYTGGVVGYWLNQGSWYNTYPTMNISNFTNEGKVTGNTQTGGIIGRLHVDNTYNDTYNSTVNTTNMKNTGDVTGVTYVGGLIGYGYADNGASSVNGCTSSANVEGEAYVGGLAGYLGNIKLDSCDNVGSTVTATSYKIDGTNYYAYVGGYVGQGYGLYNLTNKVDITYEKEGSYVGGLAGYANSIVQNCLNEGTITAKKASAVGGLVGYANCGGAYTHTALNNTGDVTGGDNYVGGIFGRVNNSVSWYNNNPTFTMTRFTNEGAITGGTYVGGIIGHLNVQNTYSDSYNSSVKINNFTNTGDVTGAGTHVGGLIGYGYSDHTGSAIEDCESSASIEGEAYVGGLAGYLGNIQLHDSSNENSTVTATAHYLSNTTYYAYLGGYVGRGYSVNGCTNAVELTYTDKGIYVGGIAGYLTSSVQNCTNSANVTASKASYVGGVVGLASNAGGITHTTLENSGNVTGSDYVGGVFGQAYNYVSWYNSYPVITMTKLTNSGTISGQKYTAGIVGHVYANNGYNDSYNSTLTMTAFTNTGDVTGTTYVGGLIGYGYADHTNSVVMGSSSSANVKAEAIVGGLAGWLENIKIDDCDNVNSTVTATSYILDGTNQNVYLGGYVGRGYAVYNCVNAVDITYTEKARFVGGVIGYATGAVQNCTNSANVAAANASYVGGIVGTVTVGGGHTHTSLENSGAVTGNTYVGGIFGQLYNSVSWYNNYPVVTITNIKNTGSVTGSNYLGGVIGYFYAHNVYNNSYNTKMSASQWTSTGVVKGADGTTPTYMGLLFGSFTTDGASTLNTYDVGGSSEALYGSASNLTISA